MAAHPVCIEHARDSYVGHPLCPCGGRAGYVATLWPRAQKEIGRYDADLWVEYDERTYLLCADCSIRTNCQEVVPWQDSRPGPEQGGMLDTLLRRVRFLENMGYGTSAAFHVMSSSIEGGFLRGPAQWLNRHAEQLVPLASDYTGQDRRFVHEHLRANRPDEETLERMECLDRLIESWQTREPAEAEVEVVPMPLTLEAAAD